MSGSNHRLLFLFHSFYSRVEEKSEIPAKIDRGPSWTGKVEKEESVEPEPSRARIGVSLFHAFSADDHLLYGLLAHH